MKDSNLNIRINSELLNKLRKQAKKENRTLSNYVTTILKNDIEQKGGNQMNSVQEILKENEYDSFEINTLKNYHANVLFHTDNLDGDFEPDSTVDVNGVDVSNHEVVHYEVMDNETYNSTVLANACTTTDDYAWDNDHKVLVIAIQKY